MLIAALTGGIATGKSTVGQMFRNLGAYVFESDVMAHRAVEPPSPLLTELARAFGAEVLDEQGRLKRRHLRDIVFQDAAARSKLNQILHPAIKKMLQAEIDQVKDPKAIILIDVPLLFEIGWDKNFSTIIMVYTPPAMQVARLMERDRLNRQQALIALSAQLPVEEKKEKSQFIIDNSGVMPETLAQVQNTWLALQKISALKPC